MLKSYFKIGIRNIFKKRSSSIINVLGLTIGMTAFILITRYIQYEFSYDAQHEKMEQIYRIAQYQKGNTFRGTDRFAVTAEPMGRSMKDKFSEVEESTIMNIYNEYLEIDQQIFSEKILFADEYFLDVFTYPLSEGVGKEVLKDPTTIIITDQMAKKHFGNASPIGKTIILDNKPLVIKGHLKEIPKNQHFNFDYITSVKNSSDYDYDVGLWDSNNYKTYIVLKEGSDYKKVEEKMKMFEPIVAEGYKGSNLLIAPTFFLQPLKDIHLYSNINIEFQNNGDIRYIWLSISIGLIILLLALINYINLATVKSPKRTKNTGIRKVLGGSKQQLIFQFITESSIITLFSFTLAVVLAIILLPFFNQIVDKEIPVHLESHQVVLFGMLFFALVLGGLAGLYPAIVSSSVKTVTALKGRWFKSQKGNSLLRNSLVIGQFAVAIILVIGTVTIYQQLEFIQTKKLGYNRDQIIFLPYQNFEIFDKTEIIGNELIKHPSIKNASFAAYTPLDMYSQGFADEWEGNDKSTRFGIYRNYVDDKFIDLYEMEIIEGRNFSANIPSDTLNTYILNEAAVKAIGWESAVGKKFERGKVIGVVKDFHFLPFDLKIEPLFLRYRKRSNEFGMSNLALKINMEDKENAIAHFQSTLKGIAPKLPFQHQFMDESYTQLYDAEKRFGKAFSIFTFLALFIACIGLFGLVSHNVTQRTKEIGIRKVIGASITNIVVLLSKDFLKLVVLAIIIAFPIAYFFMENWLQDFAYRINISWHVFILSGLAAVLIAFLTMSVKSIKAAIANPTDSLNSE